MRKHLFDKKPFKKSYVPDGMTKDVAATCKEYDQIIKDNPIDVQLLGIAVTVTLPLMNLALHLTLVLMKLS